MSLNLPPVGPNVSVWANDVRRFLVRQWDRLTYKADGISADQDGIILWDAVNGYPIVSKDGAFEPVTIGVTATADELNILDGATLTTAELNFVDGVTSNIQTQLNGKAEVSGTSGSSVTTSGTEVIVTGIPSGVTRVTVILNFVGTNGTAPVEVRIGDSGGISASGYIGTSALQINASATTDVSSSTGFSLGGNIAAVGYNGFLTLEGLGGTSWYASYTLRSAVGEVVTGSGVESLSGTLDRISIATDGVDTFDNGFIEVKWSY